MEEFNVGVLGCGYVGLVTGACMAHLGHRVACVDRDERRGAELSARRVAIYEPDLDVLVDRNVREGRLSFAGSGELARVVRESDVVFVAVGTPPGEDGSANLSSVAAVARGIGEALAKSTVPRSLPLIVVNKSTVPVGSGDRVSMLVQEGAEGSGKDVNFRVVSCPEFLREGSAVYDTLYPDRIVVGADSREALDRLRELYEPVIQQTFPSGLDPRPKATVPFVTTDLASAEMIKYAANAFLATKISFINEISNLCELVGADVSSVAHGIGLDERIGPRFLGAGIGWGGSCFPKDVAALRSTARERGHDPVLLDAAVAVNEQQRRRVISKLQRDLDALEGKRVALLGLAFKPNTDDLREAPSMEIARALDAHGAHAVGYDPVAGKAAARLAPALNVVYNPYEALAGAHAAVVVTEWEEIRSLNHARMAELMEPPKLLVDGRNAMDPAAAREAGLLYRGFGRG